MNKSRLFFLLILVGLCCILGLAASAWISAIPTRAEILFGPPSPDLQPLDRWRLAWSLVENVEALTLPLDKNGAEQSFEIDFGEPAMQVIERLTSAGLVRSSTVFRDYLIYSGADTRLVPGTYTLSPSMSALEIAADIQNISATGIRIVILPGWRMEEIAAALPTSGLEISPEEFLAIARGSPGGGVSAFWPAGNSHEGLLFPDVYALPRSLTADAFIGILTENFRTHLTAEIQARYAEQGLSVYEAVSLASIVQREAVVDDEMPLIASVFLNRLAISMKLDADPTVQYSLGYSDAWGWWKSPLSLSDLGIDHTYNTYRIPGLPPGPISNPGIEALSAVAYPESSGYYYFRAACDGTGRHDFSVTFEEHAAKGCTP